MSKLHKILPTRTRFFISSARKIKKILLDKGYDEPLFIY